MGGLHSAPRWLRAPIEAQGGLPLLHIADAIGVAPRAAGLARGSPFGTT